MLGAINALNKKPNSGIGYDHLKKKVVTSQITPQTSTAGGIMNTLNARLTNQANSAVTSALAAPKQPAQFSYNAEADPMYQAAIRRAEANANTASGNATAEMNRRGILNSTITGDRVAQIHQSEMGRVSDTILPQLEQQAYARFQDEQNRKFQGEQLALQKGQLTGTYVSPEMQEQESIVMQAKQDYANAKTPQDRIAAHQRAEAARAVLESLGVNSGQIGSNVTLDQAQANHGRFGIKTQEALQNEFNNSRSKKTDNLNAANIVSQMTGKVINPQDDWTGLFRQANNPDTPFSLAGQNQKLSNDTAAYNLNELTDPNSTTNKVKALQLTMTQIDADNYSEESRLKLEQLRKTVEQIGKEPAVSEYDKQMQEIELTKAQLELKNLQDGKPDKPLLAKDFMTLINDLPYLQDEIVDGERTGRKIVNDKVGLKTYILSLGLSDAETIKLYTAYGLPLPKGGK